MVAMLRMKSVIKVCGWFFPFSITELKGLLPSTFVHFVRFFDSKRVATPKYFARVGGGLRDFA